MKAISTYEMVRADIFEMKGQTLEEISMNPEKDRIDFCTKDLTFRMEHKRVCCEICSVEDITGDLTDLIGSPIIMAEYVEYVPPIKDQSSDDSQTWTMVKLATVKGYVTIRWYGASNGYYSETPNFFKSI